MIRNARDWGGEYWYVTSNLASYVYAMAHRKWAKVLTTQRRGQVGRCFGFTRHGGKKK
jgi:hypothetical protein